MSTKVEVRVDVFQLVAAVLVSSMPTDAGDLLTFVQKLPPSPQREMAIRQLRAFIDEADGEEPPEPVVTVDAPKPPIDFENTETLRVLRMNWIQLMDALKVWLKVKRPDLKSRGRSMNATAIGNIVQNLSDDGTVCYFLRCNPRPTDIKGKGLGETRRQILVDFLAAHGIDWVAITTYDGWAPLLEKLDT